MKLLIVFIFCLIPSLLNLVSIFYLLHIPAQTTHHSGTQEAHVLVATVYQTVHAEGPQTGSLIFLCPTNKPPRCHPTFRLLPSLNIKLNQTDVISFTEQCLL